jgi:chromate transporter
MSFPAIPDSTQQAAASKASPASQLQPAPRPTVGELFIAFASISLSGFGGVLAWARRKMVEERRWLTAEQFNEAYALCAFLPGGNIINFSVIFGARMRGAPGALAAIGGLLGPPMVLVTIVGAIFAHYGDVPALRRMLTGVAAAAAGLMIATVAKMARQLFHNRAGPALDRAVDLRRDRRHALAVAGGADRDSAGEHRCGLGAAMTDITMGVRP